MGTTAGPSIAKTRQAARAATRKATKLTRVVGRRRGRGLPACDETVACEVAIRALAESLLAHLTPEPGQAESGAAASAADLHLIAWIASSYDPASPAAEMAEAHLRRFAREHGLDGTEAS